MKSEIENLFSDEILNQAINLFELEKDKTTKIDSFESFIFESVWKGVPCILRITHSSHRNMEQVKGELDWINYLADNSAPVCQAYPSSNGNYVEKIKQQESSYFLVAIFQKAEGLFLNKNKHLLTDSLIMEWGKLVGKLHRLTKEYLPAIKESKRPVWSDYTPKIEEYLNEEPVALKRAKEIIKTIRSLPKDRDSYGLIHYDIHQANFLINNGEITLFDFDDSEYNWFVADIAVILFTALWAKLNGEKSREEFISDFLIKFLKGYKQENELSNWWVNKISEFLRMRHILLYAVIIREHKLNPTEWSKKLIEEWKPMIENNIPYVTLKLRKIL
ncbi:MAG: phosphotransferase enzyme family protein [Candidatus Heimdallarchaeota archaeon]